MFAVAQRARACYLTTDRGHRIEGCPVSNAGGHMKYHEAAYCGDFCGGCEQYLKTCSGCDPKYKEECPFIACCRQHQAVHCGVCAEFPCTRLSAFVPDDRPGHPRGYHIENLRCRAIVGTADWLAVQRAKHGLPAEGVAEADEGGGE